MTRYHRLFVASAVSALLAGAVAPTADVPPAPPKKEAGPPEPKPLKLPTRKEAMQRKLKSMQAMLEGIALNDFARIRSAADDLMQVSNGTDFLNAYKGPEYLFHVEMMRRPAEAVAKKAKAENMDGVMIGYNELTLSCLRCHQGMRDKKFEVISTRRDGGR